MFGAKRRRTRELANEVLRPLALETKKLTEESRRDLERQIRSTIDRGRDQELYDRQTGWSKGER